MAPCGFFLWDAEQQKFGMRKSCSQSVRTIWERCRSSGKLFLPEQGEFGFSALLCGSQAVWGDDFGVLEEQGIFSLLPGEEKNRESQPGEIFLGLFGMGGR